MGGWRREQRERENRCRWVVGIDCGGTRDREKEQREGENRTRGVWTTVAVSGVCVHADRLTG